MLSDVDLPNIGDYVVYCGRVCMVKSVDKSRRLLTVKVMDRNGGYTSYVYAEDIDRFLLPRTNKAEL